MRIKHVPWIILATFAIAVLAFVIQYLLVPNSAPALLTPVPTPQPSVNTHATETLTPESLYLLINAHRQEQKLAELNTHSQLELSAQYKLKDMVEQKYYRHTDPTNTPSWQFFRQAGYQYALAGENLSFAVNTPWQILQAWANSPAHNEQLLNAEYRDMGVAIDCETFREYQDGGCIVVLHLGKE